MTTPWKRPLTTVALAAAVTLSVSSCHGTGNTPSDPSSSSADTLSISSLHLAIKKVGIGSTVEVPEMGTGGVAKVTALEAGERTDKRQWVRTRIVFGNGDTFEFKLYEHDEGSSVAPTIGDRLVIALVGVDGKEAGLGVLASGANTLDLNPASQQRKNALTQIRKGASRHVVAMGQQLDQDGVIYSADLNEANDGRSLEVFCGQSVGNNGLRATFEAYTGDAVSIPGIGTCKLADYQSVRSSSKNGGSATIELNHP